MAVQDIRENIKGIYNRLEQAGLADNKTASEYARSVQDKKYAHTITIDGARFASQMAVAINNAGGAGIAGESDTTDAVRSVISNWKHLPFAKGKGVSGEDSGFTLTIWRTSADNVPNPKFIRKINKEFKDEALKQWKQLMEGNMFTAGRADSPRDRNLASGIDPDLVSQDADYGFSHDINSNVANAALLNELEEDILPNVVGASESTNMALEIFRMLNIGWRQEVDPADGKMKWIITGELAGFNPASQARAGVDLGQEWEQAILDKLEDVLANPAAYGMEAKFEDPTFRASIPFLDQAVDSSVRKLIKPYERLRDEKGRFVKMTNVPKKHAKSRRGGSVKNPSKGSKKTKKKYSRKAPTVSMRREKGTKARTTDSAIQLTRLKAYINKRLPAEVRRNMGRPALINRTGRFSSSVQLLNLIEGKNTLIAKYTYLLSPYETFENTGKRTWPLGYNPKKVIAKSIRNLAMGRVEQKLTLRRA